MQPRHRTAFPALILLAALIASCGAPSSPSDGGVVLEGRVVGATAASVATAAQAGTSRALAEVITVTVAEAPSIATTVDADGTFTLRGLPEGAFTLVFSRAGVTLGSVAFDGVAPNQEITVTIRVDPAGVTVLEQRRNGISHGDVELEGLVAEVLRLDPAGESRFLVKGRTVVARAGVTAIREGGRGRSAADVTVGRRVHVKGVFLPLENGAQPILAHEIKLQGSGDDGPGDDDDQDQDDDDGDGDDDGDDGDDEDDGDDDDDGGTGQTCALSGGSVGSRVELEGTVTGGSSGAFTMRTQGNRSTVPIDVEAAGAEFKCNGPGSPTIGECKARLKDGAKVHVSGSVLSCDLDSAAVRASRVMIQK
jgi:hypothetical protein